VVLIRRKVRIHTPTPQLQTRTYQQRIDYIDTMKFGYVTEPGNHVTITHPLTQGGIVAVYYLPGTLVGAMLGGWIGERIGRIRTIALGAAWAVIGATLQCSAQNADWYAPEGSPDIP
jgi:MFS family permease